MKKKQNGYTPLEVAHELYGLFNSSRPELPQYGKDVKIGIIALDEGVIDLSIIHEAFQQYGFGENGTQIPKINLLPLNGWIGKEGCPWEEARMDIEILGSLCPLATINVYHSQDSQYDFASAIRTAVLDDCDIISISWGLGEDVFEPQYLRIIEEYLLKADKAGITVCVASGDTGACASKAAYWACDFGVQVPANIPTVLACGGTQISSDEEIVWNTLRITVDENGKPILLGGASGGGVSQLFLSPTWQSSFAKDVNPIPPGLQSGRVVPDVCALAAPYYCIHDGERSDVIGGTSASAPMWAGITGMIMSERFAREKDRFNLCPWLYKNAAQNNLLSGVDTGSNVVPGNVNCQPNGYHAVSRGISACAGIGVPHGLNLLDAAIGS